MQNLHEQFTCAIGTYTDILEVARYITMINHDISYVVLHNFHCIFIILTGCEIRNVLFNVNTIGHESPHNDMTVIRTFINIGKSEDFGKVLNQSWYHKCKKPNQTLLPYICYRMNEPSLIHVMLKRKWGDMPRLEPMSTLNSDAIWRQ